MYQKGLVSIIIPCYNMGIYIEEAISSVMHQSYKFLEVIIVNDGSNDNYTLSILERIHHPNIRVIHQENKGLAAARNKGIQLSTGEYILPLDSDDKISENYINAAVQILEHNREIVLVYGKAFLFGDKSGIWELEEFDWSKFIFYNQIHASAIYRRQDYDKTQGYDVSMKYGWEDWELWINLLKANPKVHIIDEEFLYYRIRSKSMIRLMDDEQISYSRRYIYCKHAEIYQELFSDPLTLYEKYRDTYNGRTSIINSFSFKIGSTILYPLKKIKQCLSS